MWSEPGLQETVRVSRLSPSAERRGRPRNMCCLNFGSFSSCKDAFSLPLSGSFFILFAHTPISMQTHWNRGESMQPPFQAGIRLLCCFCKWVNQCVVIFQEISTNAGWIQLKSMSEMEVDTMICMNSSKDTGLLVFHSKVHLMKDLLTWDVRWKHLTVIWWLKGKALSPSSGEMV